MSVPSVRPPLAVSTPSAATSVSADTVSMATEETCAKVSRVLLHEFTFWCVLPMCMFLYLPVADVQLCIFGAISLE